MVRPTNKKRRLSSFFRLEKAALVATAQQILGLFGIGGFLQIREKRQAFSR